MNDVDQLKKPLLLPHLIYTPSLFPFVTLHYYIFPRTPLAQAPSFLSLAKSIMPFISSHWSSHKESNAEDERIASQEGLLQMHGSTERIHPGNEKRIRLERDWLSLPWAWIHILVIVLYTLAFGLTAMKTANRTRDGPNLVYC